MGLSTLIATEIVRPFASILSATARGDVRMIDMVKARGNVISLIQIVAFARLRSRGSSPGSR
jgi:hypothetical protein